MVCRVLVPLHLFLLEANYILLDIVLLRNLGCLRMLDVMIYILQDDKKWEVMCLVL